jgi:hypothetical protein
VKYILDVTKDEYSWLDKNFKKGDIAYYYSGYTYGCRSSAGPPFTIEDSDTPFFELLKTVLKNYNRLAAPKRN